MDHPDWMFLHGPVIVTAKVTNTGPAALLVPVKEGCLASNGFFFEIGSSTKSPEVQCPLAVARIGGSVWMKPGDEWWIQSDVREWLDVPGVYEVRVKIQSSGECVASPLLADTIPVEPIRSSVISAVYNCWSGETASAMASIEVVDSTPEDKEALEYVQSLPLEKVPKSCLECLLARSHSQLVEKYPSSYYTYLSGYYGQGEKDLERVMELQPGNVLAPYARMKQAQRALERSLLDRAPTQLDVSGLDLPDGLREYLTWKKKRNQDEALPVKPDKNASK